jgi:hypothetical protein
LITFFGSNDFHHVSLALIRRFHQPFNVVCRREERREGEGGGREREEEGG